MTKLSPAKFAIGVPIVRRYEKKSPTFSLGMLFFANLNFVCKILVRIPIRFVGKHVRSLGLYNTVHWVDRAQQTCRRLRSTAVTGV